jgi:hypothetical protein
MQIFSVLKEPILIGHNICNFEIPILIRKLKESNSCTTYCQLVKGFVDTLKLARREIDTDEVVNYKQQTLVDLFLDIYRGPGLPEFTTVFFLVEFVFLNILNSVHCYVNHY